MRSVLAVDLPSKRKVPREQVYSSTCTLGSKRVLSTACCWWKIAQMKQGQISLAAFPISRE